MFETFSGTGVTSNSIFGYFGAVWAFGYDVTEPGPRLKAVAGKGRYAYRTTLDELGGVTVDGQAYLAQVLAGYLWRRGEWTIKAYAGGDFQKHDLYPNDPGNSVRGGETGFVGQLELWRNLGPAGFLSLDASYGSAFETYRTEARLGRRIGARVRAGIQGGALGNEEFDSGRGGGFVTVQLWRSELTLSGGITGDYLGDDLSGYAALGLYTKF